MVRAIFDREGLPGRLRVVKRRAIPGYMFFFLSNRSSCFHHDNQFLFS